MLDAGCGDAWIKSEFKRFNKPIDYYGIDLGIGDEDLEYPDKVFSEMARVVAPGGRIFLSVPQSFALHQRPYDYHRFTKYILEKIRREK